MTDRKPVLRPPLPVVQRIYTTLCAAIDAPSLEEARIHIAHAVGSLETVLGDKVPAVPARAPAPAAPARPATPRSLGEFAREAAAIGRRAGVTDLDFECEICGATAPDLDHHMASMHPDPTIGVPEVEE